MGLPVLILPALPPWAQQLANILPLTVLIEFIDFAMKLHVFDLAGSVPSWNWPMTPRGARLLMSDRDYRSECCLDAPDQCRKPLQCIDGRYGNSYPCSASTTVRFCASSVRRVYHLPNVLTESTIASEQRPQELSLFYLRRKATAFGHNSTLRRIRLQSLRRSFVFGLGWLVWACIVSTSLLSGLFVAFAYLLALPCTGIMAQIILGGVPRSLDFTGRQLPRLIIAADNWNASQWWGFYGDSKLVNSLLNRQLRRQTGRFSNSFVLQWVMRLLILGQWCLAIASCTLQDWNALVISFWSILCILVSEFAYNANESVGDWLANDCGVEMVEVKATFTSRRAMLGVLIYLNPDQENREWVEPILRDPKWEQALLKCFAMGEYDEAAMPKGEFFNRWVKESLIMGRKFEQKMQELQAENADCGEKVV